MKPTKVTSAIRKQMVKEYTAGATLTKLSVKHKMGIPAIRDELVAGGAVIRNKGGSAPFDETRDERMEKMYRDGYSLVDIGSEFGVSRERVRQILRDRGVESLGRGKRRRPSHTMTTKEKKIAAAYDRGVRPSALMERYPGLTYVSLQAILRKAGVATKPKGFFNRRDDYENTVTGVIRDYQRGDDTGEIADRYNLCGRTEIYKFLQREGIPVRHQHRDEYDAAVAE